MKKLISFFALSALIIVLTSGYSFAQFQLKLGPSAGLNYNIHTGSDLPQSGSGFGFVIGGQVDMSFTPHIGLIANMQFYDNRSGSFSKTSSNQYTDQNTGAPITSTVSDQNDASIAYFMIEPLFKLSLANSGMFFFVGPAIGFNVQGSFQETISETFPTGYQNNNTKQTSKGSIQNMNARFELKLGGGYDIPLGGLYLTPQVSFGYGLTQMKQDVNWRILTIQALVTVKFQLI